MTHDITSPPWSFISWEANVHHSILLYTALGSFSSVQARPHEMELSELMWPKRWTGPDSDPKANRFSKLFGLGGWRPGPYVDLRALSVTPTIKLCFISWPLSAACCINHGLSCINCMHHGPSCMDESLRRQAPTCSQVTKKRNLFALILCCSSLFMIIYMEDCYFVYFRDVLFLSTSLTGYILFCL